MGNTFCLILIMEQSLQLLFKISAFPDNVLLDLLVPYTV